jgi:hypothetical protein
MLSTFNPERCPIMPPSLLSHSHGPSVNRHVLRSPGLSKRLGLGLRLESKVNPALALARHKRKKKFPFLSNQTLISFLFVLPWPVRMCTYSYPCNVSICMYSSREGWYDDSVCSTTFTKSLGCCHLL